MYDHFTCCDVQSVSSIDDKNYALKMQVIFVVIECWSMHSSKCYFLSISMYNLLICHYFGFSSCTCHETSMIIAGVFYGVFFPHTFYLLVSVLCGMVSISWLVCFQVLTCGAFNYLLFNPFLNYPVRMKKLAARLLVA